MVDFYDLLAARLKCDDEQYSFGPLPKHLQPSPEGIRRLRAEVAAKLKENRQAAARSVDAAAKYHCGNKT